MSISCSSLSLWMERTVIVLLVLASAGLGGCSKNVADPPRTSIIMAGRQGEPIDPADFKRFSKSVAPDKPQEKETFDDYLDKMFMHLAEFCAQQKELEPKNPCRVLMFIHGGLNSQEGAVDRAAELTPKICGAHDPKVPVVRDARDNPDVHDPRFYPIFINWRSSLWSSYWDHLAHVHQGIWLKEAPPLAPYVFAVDEGKAAVEALSTWATEARHTVTHQRLNEATNAYRALIKDSGKPSKDDGTGYKPVTVNDLLEDDQLADQRNCKIGGNKNPPVDNQQLVDQRSCSDKWVPKATVAFTFWSKLLTLPLAVRAGGTGAWSVLERRTDTLFRTEAELRGIQSITNAKTVTGSAPEISADYQTGAALAHFIRRFQDVFIPQFCSEKGYRGMTHAASDIPAQDGSSKPETSCPDRLEITLVGHSMGTIVIDHLLRYEPRLDVRNIVFMASAATVEDYRDTVNPYLAAHPQTQMYHLVLHPQAELHESNYWDFAPRGTLLVWIDNFFTDPSSPSGRRVGRFSNLLPELTYTDPKIRGQIHLKVFRFGSPVSCWSPQKHGDFGSFPFWDKDFWDPKIDSQGDPSPRRLDGEQCPAVGGAPTAKKPEEKPLERPDCVTPKVEEPHSTSAGSMYRP